MDVPNLSDSQQQVLWDSWLSAETRADYFAELGLRFQKQQRLLVLSSLVLSSGATITLFSTVLPAQWNWVRPVLTILAALASFWSLLAKNERNAIDCADLHFRWNKLAMEYEDLWGSMYDDDASAKLKQLREREAEISKSGTSLPANRKMLAKSQDAVMLHHRAQVA